MTFNINVRRRFGPLDPTQVPTIPVEVDWTHQLSQALAALYIPGSPSGFADVGGMGPTLIPQSAVALASGEMGPSLLCNVANCGAYATASLDLVLGPEISLFWAGATYGAALSSNGTYIGLAGTPPNNVYTLNQDGNGALHLYDNNGGSGNAFWTNATVPVFSSGSLGASTAKTSSALYFNGIAQSLASDTNSYPVVPSNYGGPLYLGVGYRAGLPARAPNCLTAMASLHLRALSADEMAWLNAEPFAMVIPLMRRSRAAPAIPPGVLAGSAAAAASVTGTLIGFGAFAGTGAGAAGATGTEAGAGAMAGSGAGVGTATGTLSARGALAGSGTGLTTASGAMTGAGALAGAAAAAAGAAGVMSGAGALSGAAISSSAASATLTGTGALAGALAATSTATATLTATGALAGAAVAAATAIGNVRSAALSAAAVGTSSAAANLTGAGALAATSVAAAAAVGNLIGVGPIAGLAAATSGGSAMISGSAVPPFIPSVLRTAIGSRGDRIVISGRPAGRWPRIGPLQQPDSYLDYTYPADGETACGTDPLVSVSVSVSPSGSGETAASRITVAGSAVTVWMAGGVAGRFYLVRLEMTTQAGRVFEVLISFPIDSTLAADPLPAPPSASFGPTTNWTG